MKKIILITLMMMLAVSAFSQQILKVKVDAIPNGEYDESLGTIRITGEVLNGQKNGTWTEYHPGLDIPHYIIQYKDDMIDGLYLEFDRQAYLIKKSEYENNMLDGVSNEWARGGRVLKKQDYKEGKLDGKSYLYYDNGFLQEVSEYKDGKKNGVTTWYVYADKKQGGKVAMYTYLNGKFEGVQEIYYEDGTVSSRKMFSDNVQNGTAVEFYEDGSIKSESIYKNGELKGKVKEYKKGIKMPETK